MSSDQIASSVKTGDLPMAVCHQETYTDALSVMRWRRRYPGSADQICRTVRGIQEIFYNGTVTSMDEEYAASLENASSTAPEVIPAPMAP